MLNKDGGYWKKACHYVEKYLSKCGFIANNYHKFASMLCQQWRRFIRIKHQEVEQSKKDFMHTKHYILKNPKNMTKYDKKILKKMLKTFPFIVKYSNCIVNYHKQFNLGEKATPSLQFLKKIFHKNIHKKLRIGIESIMYNENGLFAHYKILRKYPQLRKGKSIRSNHEHKNRKVNMVTRNQCGFRSIKNMIPRIEGILDCPLVISKALMKQEKRHL